MATITLKTPEGETETFECDEDTFILDALEEAGIDHPYSCRAGACSSCAMKIVEGSVNQEDQSFLEDEQMEEEDVANSNIGGNTENDKEKNQKIMVKHILSKRTRVRPRPGFQGENQVLSYRPVSYTHLTLPTIYSV